MSDIFGRQDPNAPEGAALDLARWAEHPEVGECFNRVAQVACRLAFPGYSFHGQRTPDLVTVSVSYIEKDVFTGQPEAQYSRRWVIDNGWNEAQIAQTFLKAIITSHEHRVREHFTLDGKAIFNPHHTLEQLIATSEDQEREVEKHE
jgi:hypothetical protein